MVPPPETPAVTRSSRRRCHPIVSTGARRTRQRMTQHRTTPGSRSSRRTPAHHVTPAESIAATARYRPRGQGQQDGRFFDTDYQNNRPVASQQSVEASPGRPPPASAPERYCHCDRPVAQDCALCVEGLFCMEHPFMQCNGPCGHWLHPSCVGWHFDPVRKCVTAPFNNDLSLPLRDYSAGDLPFYCIRCWEEQKDAPAPWQDLSLAEKAVRLGLPLDDSISSSTQRRKVNLAWCNSLIGLIVHEICLYSLHVTVNMNFMHY
jgi:hypothetical protein